MKTFPFVVYLRTNIVRLLPSLIIVPLFMVLFGWLFGSSVTVSCVTALAFISWILLDNYGTFAVIDRTTGPQALAENFKRDFIGVVAALIVGYVVLLLFSVTEPAPMGPSKSYFFAAITVLFYYLGRYKGIHNGVVPFAYRLFGLGVPPRKE